MDSLLGLTDTRWHMIGHLQSDKAGKAAELFDAVDSVNSLTLAERLSVAERNAGTTLPILIEINVGGGPAKTGIAPDSPELDRLLSEVPRFQNVQVRGLMTVPPYTEDPEGARPYFRDCVSCAITLPGSAWLELGWMNCLWECRMISRLQLRKGQLACAWGRQFSGAESKLNHRDTEGQG